MADDEIRELVEILNMLSSGALATLLKAFTAEALKAVLACQRPEAQPHVVAAVHAEIQRRAELRDNQPSPAPNPDHSTTPKRRGP